MILRSLGGRLPSRHPQ